MPRPRKSGAGEVKRRSRTGCWPCKSRKVKCGEERPTCSNCRKNGVKCDYSIRLNWEGRRKKKPEIGGILDFSSSSTATPAASTSVKSESSSGQTITNGARSSPPMGSTSGSTTSSVSVKQEPLPNGPPNRESFEQPMVSPHAADFMTAVFPPMPPNELNPPEGSFQVPRQRSFSQPAQSLGGRPSNLTINTMGPGPQFQDPFRAEGGPNRMSHHALDTINEMGTPTTAQYTNNHPILSPTFPITPGGYSESGEPQFSARPSLVGEMNDQENRRPGLSVNSLLSAPPNDDESLRPIPGGGHVLFEHDLIEDLENEEKMTSYGIDRGIPDEDIDKNDDMNAISFSGSPIVGRNMNSYFGDHAPGDATPTEFGFGVNLSEGKKDDNYYYRRPVQILIPKSFEPLPKKLQENPMNLLYFHHFLNHTAHVLVPHDDPATNPFRTILPQMAVRNDNLMSLLLAYSASHRARLLEQPEPATRIAHWVEDIFPVLRQALNNPTEIISNANLATAIMLASLEIISPRAFGYEISWQKHLSLARDLIKARPGGLRFMQARARDDPLCSFLWSWFAYLDVLGSLSGGRHTDHSSDDPGMSGSLTAWLLDYDEPTPSPNARVPTSPETCSSMLTTATSPTSGGDIRDEIDCIMGFTTRCVAILARIADLARRTDSQRIAGPGRVVAGWRPMPEIEARARRLEDDLRNSLARPHPPCQRHKHTLGRWDEVEMKATNEAFHWAGLVHLHRRVLGKSTNDPDVQEAVKNIVECLEKVKRGGNAEACLLFPIFTAGCDSSDVSQREKLLERVKTIEINGMTQVHRARNLMEKVWESSQPWETLISTEFIG